MAHQQTVCQVMLRKYIMWCKWSAKKRVLAICPNRCQYCLVCFAPMKRESMQTKGNELIYAKYVDVHDKTALEFTDVYSWVWLLIS